MISNRMAVRSVCSGALAAGALLLSPVAAQADGGPDSVVLKDQSADIAKPGGPQVESNFAMRIKEPTSEGTLIIQLPAYGQTTVPLKWFQGPYSGTVGNCTTLPSLNYAVEGDKIVCQHVNNGESGKNFLPGIDVTMNIKLRVVEGAPADTVLNNGKVTWPEHTKDVMPFTIKTSATATKPYVPTVDVPMVSPEVGVGAAGAALAGGALMWWRKRSAHLSV
ncbi:hypothetical protein [Streptomyces sp. NBC_01304]|uniref:hypothetical protein n=1 Tax=Streptomyces sp. NBC_01304 TaxID=2903818 RepID=UPI002E11072F|nr:hypothetical protein OG430_42210 [Streptomyces sp. NBC_01304]